MAENYCLVEDGKITDGPRPLPVSWRNISGLNLMSDSELKKVGWLPYEDQPLSVKYDPDSQYLTKDKSVGPDKVSETYAVNNYTLSQLSDKVADLKLAKLTDLYANVKQFISYQPNGWPRYDIDLKLNVMNVIITALAGGKAEPVNCTAVKDWINAVQMEFFALKSSINVAVDLTTLNGIDVSYDYLENKYGREGVVYPDPGISTDDILQAKQDRGDVLNEINKTI